MMPPALTSFPAPNPVAGAQRANAATTGLVGSAARTTKQSRIAVPPPLHRSLHSTARGPDLGLDEKMFEGVTYRPVEPLKPAAGYIGGKRMLAKAVIAQIERVPHETYAEAFVGMGGVFFRRERAAKAEVINDRSGDVATFFRVLQRHYVAFVEMLRWQVASRREFERLMATDPATLTDLERSARFLYLQRLAFGGKVAGRTFGVSPALPARFDVTKIVPMLEELHERLARVVIENLDWSEFLPRYDRPGTLFYLDPPYWGSERDYGAGFERSDYERLAGVLRRLQGRFILSINDVPAIRKAFAGFAMKSVAVTYTVAAGKARPARELIIMDGRKGGY
jgi:DNA adenine methylase